MSPVMTSLVTKTHTLQSGTQHGTRPQVKRPHLLQSRLLHLQKGYFQKHMVSPQILHPSPTIHQDREYSLRLSISHLLPVLPASCHCFLNIFSIPCTEDGGTEIKVPLPILSESHCHTSSYCWNYTALPAREHLGQLLPLGPCSWHPWLLKFSSSRNPHHLISSHLLLQS